MLLGTSGDRFSRYKYRDNKNWALSSINRENNRAHVSQR